MAPDLDFRDLHLGKLDIAAFQTRQDAVRERKSKYRSWEPWTIARARNRFWRFWVLVRTEPEGTFVIACQGGGAVRLPQCPGHVVGGKHATVPGQ
jgi:hypothetical protein